MERVVNMRRQLVSAVVVLLVLSAEVTNGQGPKFEVGKSYTFDFNSEIRANSRGVWSHLTADEIADGLTVETKAQVVIRGLSETEFLLVVKDGQLKTRSFTKDAQEGPPASVKMENSVMKFTYVDGMVTSTTQNPDEPTWSVNMKRAVLSLLQNKAFSPSMDKATSIEESVLGECVTRYEKTTSDSGEEWRKEVVLGECGLSEGSQIISQGVPYHLPVVTNKPLFGFLRPSGTVVECRQSVSKESTIMTSAVCEVKDSGHSLLNHKQQSSLTFVDSSSDVPLPEEDVTSKLTMTSQSLLFDFLSTPQPTVEAAKMAEEKLKVLLGYEDFDMNAKDELSFFADFKSLIPQVADLSPLKELVDKSPRRKIFYDAAAEVASDSAILLLVQADKANELDLTTKLTFYGSLPFAKKLGLKAIGALAELMNEVKVPTEPETKTPETMKHFAKDVSVLQHLLLGASGAAYRYCMQTDPSCGNKGEYVALIDALASYVKESGHEGAEVDVTLAALYALGNIVTLTPNAAKKLETLISNDQILIPIRMAAIDAFRRDPCQPQLAEIVKSKLADKANSDDIRIAAYLATVKCLTPEAMAAIQAILSEEEDSATKGFIASHIRNIQTSSSPSTLHLRESLSTVEVPSTIEKTPKRVSSFVEHSTFRHKENVGFSGSLTVFFAPGQTAPTFASFNKTIDLFGRSFNFIEVGLSGRMLPSTRMFHDDAAPADWSSLHRAIHARDSYVRVFGTTLAMGMDGIHKAMQIAFFKVNNGSLLADLIQPATLLDEKVSTATLTGLPLTFGLESSFLKDLKLEMTADPLIKLANSLFALAPEEGQDFDLKFDIKLHASMSGVASASVGGDSPMRIGYAVEGRMDKKYSWGIEVKSSRQSPEESSVSFKLNFPEERIAEKKITGKLWSFQEVNGVSAEGSTAVAVPPKMRVNAKCDSCQWLGLKSCGNTTTPESRRLFPFSVAVSIGKLEESVTGFLLTSSTKRETDANGDLRSLHTLSLSSPGSSSAREIKGTLIQTVHAVDWDTWTNYDWEVEASLNDQKIQGIVRLNASEWEPSLYLGVSQNSQPVEDIVDIKFTGESDENKAQNAKWSLKGKFGGPLSYFAEELSVLGGPNAWTNTEQERTVTLGVNGKLSSEFLDNPRLEGKFFQLESGASYGIGKTTVDNTFDVKLFCGERSLEVTLGNIESVIYANDTTADIEGAESSEFNYGIRYPRLVGVGQKLSMSYVPSWSRSKSVALEYGYAVEMEGEETAVNTSITLDQVISRHPLKAEMEMDMKFGETFKANGTLQANLLKESGSKQLGKMRFDTQDFQTLEVDGEIKGVTEFKGSADVTEKKGHVHIDVDILPRRASVSIDVDFADDGNVVNEQTSAILTTDGGESVVTKNTSTIVNRAERSFKHQGTVTDKEGRVLESLHMEAQLQPSFESSGVSTFSWDFHNAEGRFCAGSLNKTLTLSPPIYKSLVEAEVNAGHKGKESKEPIRIRKEVTYDASVGPEYSAQGHLSVVEKVTSQLMNLDVSKDISWSVKKEQPEAKMRLESNFTLNGEQGSSSLEGQWKGDTADPTKGEINFSGNLKDPRQTGEGDLKISYEGDIKTLQTVRVGSEVTSTPVATGEKTTVLLMNVTKTLKVPPVPLMSMSATEVGNLKLPLSDAEFIWSQEFVLAEKDFVFHKDVKVLKGGVEKFEEDFLIHVSVHVGNDNEVSVRTDHNFNSRNPQCPFRQMNFTLSR